VIGAIHVSTTALRRNAEALRTLAHPSQAAFVVKSNAYGHGLVETARAVEPLAARLCVYGAAEALQLRDAGITAPILILGPIEPSALPEVLARDCEIALWDVGPYLATVLDGARAGHTTARVHLKIDTGVGRYGIRGDDALDVAEAILQHSDIEIAGVFSHLAAAEERNSPFTELQLERFARAYAGIRTLFEGRSLPLPIAHIAGSAAAILWPQTRLDMVRFGIALYGLWPSEQTRDAAPPGLALEPALSFRSSLVTTRYVNADTPLGYGCSYVAPHEMRIGVVPLGYADGIPRALSNTGAFVVDGARCPIVGRVAMNATLLDITAASNARSGSRVTLIGTDGDASVSADDWAHWANTINYEIVARLPATLPRIYD
jgi:alanine racemase